MSLAREMSAVGQLATAPFEEDSVKNLRSGKSFNAKIVPLEDLAIDTLQGVDPRATDIFYVRDKSVKNEILAGDLLSALGATFEVVPKKDPENPVSLHLEFHCMKLAEVDS